MTFGIKINWNYRWIYEKIRSIFTFWLSYYRFKNKKIGKFVTKPIISKTDLLKSCDIGLSTVIMDRKLITNKNKFCNLTTKEDYFG